MESILSELGLDSLTERFKDERIDTKVVLSMSESDLSGLGVSTIGDRVRLRELCTNHVESQEARPGCIDSVRQERNLLFQPSGSARRSNGSGPRGRKGKYSRQQRQWSVQFVCLASRNASKTLTSTDKQILHQAGLGQKKIKLSVDDSEQEVFDKVTSDSKDENGNPLGFPQLRSCGGFEMLQCLANCRDLSVINCSWSVQELKCVVGGQAKIYLRPIQVSKIM